MPEAGSVSRGLGQDGEAYNSGFEDVEAVRLRFEEFRSRHEPSA